MAYQILKTNGTLLTTIPDGTINTTSTSIDLPGRNYAGYGQALDTNFVHMLENFANSGVPANALVGQLWYDTGNSVMRVCPTYNESNAANWTTLTAAGGTTTFGTVTVTGNLTCGNANLGNLATANNAVFGNLTVTSSANIANANLTGTTNVANLVTTLITTGANTTPGSIFGTWTLTGGASGNSLVVANGNIYTQGIRTDNFYYANGTAISFAGSYSNSNVATYLPTYTGALGSASNLTSVFCTVLSTGANTTAGTITGNWTLSSGSRLISTYADLAERFEADQPYDAGTVVELGGAKEITAVKYDLSEDVFGVISNTAAYIMNGAAGEDGTHPPIAVGGRVKVKVKGKINKGQRLVSAGNGVARAATNGEATAFNTIGRSLENKHTDDIGTVEAFVKIN